MTNLTLKAVLFVVLAAGFAAQGRAETIQGEVQQVGKDGRAFSVLNQTSKENAEIFLSPETKFNGLSSLLDLIKGDEVTVAAQRNTANGRWEADAVTVVKMVIRNPQSDIETLKETPEKSAAVASLETETKVRTEKEMRVFLEQFDKDLAGIKNSVKKDRVLKKKFKELTKNIKQEKKAAWKNVEAFAKAPVDACNAAKADADASIQGLKNRLQTLKEQIVFGPASSDPKPAAVVVGNEVTSAL